MLHGVGVQIIARRGYLRGRELDITYRREKLFE